MCVFSTRSQWLTASGRVNHRFWVGRTTVYWLLPLGPVGVACCRGAVRNRETRWAASHRRSAPRHTHLGCTEQHHHDDNEQNERQQQHSRCHKTSSSTFCRLIQRSIEYTVTYISASDFKGCLNLKHKYQFYQIIAIYGNVTLTLE